MNIVSSVLNVEIGVFPFLVNKVINTKDSIRRNYGVFIVRKK
jgi:hypothetical protein